MHSLFNMVELVNTQRIPLGGAQKIAVQYISESIFLYETDGDEVILKEFFNESDPELFARITVEGDEIRIKHGPRPKIFSFLRGYIEVYIPKAYYGALDISSVSGKIEALGTLVRSEISLASTSGSLAVGDITAGTALLSYISGSVDVRSLQAVARVRSTSGSIRIADAAGSGQLESVSGTVEASYHAVMGDITAGSTSGRVRLQLPPDLSFYLEAHSVSGRIDVGFDGSLSGGRRSVSGEIGKTPRLRVKVGTVSGRVEVLPRE